MQHPRTGRFLLYVNYVRKDGGYGGNAVFEAALPEGPFELKNPVMNLGRLCPGPAASDKPIPTSAMILSNLLTQASFEMR